MESSPFPAAGPRATRVAVLAVLLCWASGARATDRVVNTFATGFDSDPGTLTLDEAVAAANSFDRITFDGGLGEGTIIPESTLELPDDVTVIGPASLDITIDGDGKQIFQCGGFGPRIENLVLTGGVTHDGFRGNGGAINSNGNLWVVNCILEDNVTDMSTATGDRMGAAVFQDGGVLRVVYCSFERNGFDFPAGEYDRHGVYGGAIAGFGTFEIDGCLFEQNKIEPTGEDDGKAWGSCVYYFFPFEYPGQTRATLTIDRTWFIDNKNDDDSGKGTVVNSGQDLSVDDCVFRGNEAIFGGAIWSGTAHESPGGATNSAITKVSWSTFDDNEVSRLAPFSDSGHGGAIWSEDELEADYCVFVENVATQNGGAVWAEGHCDIDTCYFRGNVSFGKGSVAFIAESEDSHVFHNSVAFGNFAVMSAVIHTAADTTITHSSFLYNSSEAPTAEDLGVIHAVSQPGVSVAGCMLGWNSAAGGSAPGIDVSQHVASAGYNLIQNPHSLFVGQEPEDLLWITPRAYRYPNGSAMLFSSSPGINRGDPAASLPLNPVDIFGNPRIAGGRIDIGGIEIREIVLNLQEFLAFYGVTNGSDDDDGDRLVNIVEALLAGVPIDGTDASPLKPASGAAAASFPRAPRNGGGEPFTVEFPLDERITFLEGRLQTSPDLVTWTDRATYNPLGGGLGIQRTGHGGATLVESAKTGYAWTMREELDASGDRIFVRIDVREP